LIFQGQHSLVKGSWKAKWII